MAESSRTLTKKAGAAALERTLEALMPELFRRLERMDERLGAVDREMHGLREHMDARFDQTQDVINEIGQRIARVEGRLEELGRQLGEHSDRMDRQSDKMDQWIERLIRVELGQGARRKKRAG